MPDPKGFGLRHDMIRRAFDFKKTLKNATKKEAERIANETGGSVSATLPLANYIFVGDLNTMGMDYIIQKRSLIFMR